MATNGEKAAEAFKKHLAPEEAVSDWVLIEQGRIDAFADAIDDHQYIHVDPEKAARLSPYKTTIAHGFLTLSLLTKLIDSIPAVDPAVQTGVTAGINYGFDKVRFVAPVPVDSRIRARRQLLQVDLKDPNTIQIKQQVTVEVENQSKPCLVAQWLTRRVYSG
jgi:acyl dehydratase